MWDEPLGISGYPDILSMSIDGDDVVIVEGTENGSHRIYFMEDERVRSYLIKPMRCLKISYPYIILLYGTDEIWVIPILNPHNIHRYFMES